MPPLRRLFRRLRRLKQLNTNYTYFAVEIILLVVIVFAVGANLQVRADSNRAQVQNESLFFIHLSENTHLNERLADAYGTVRVKVEREGELVKQVLAASTKNKAQSNTDETPLPTMSGSALQKPSPATSDGTFGTKRDTQIYTVQNGDTIAKIASIYNLNQQTLLWENNLTSTSLIRPGQELRILPGDGVKHTIKKGETLYEIANKYDISIDIILDDNGIEIAEHIFPGDEIFIRNGQKQANPAPSRSSVLVRQNNIQRVEVASTSEGGSQALLWPIPGCSRISQGYWYRHRAIDVPCKYQPIVASAPGVVELSGWQGGYGYTIVVNHQNGDKTRVAHLSRLDVSAGDSVSAGQTLGISGNTGRSTGPHVHFEIIRNGVYLNPLSVVSR